MKKIILISVLALAVILYSVSIKRGVLSLLILVDIVQPPEKALMGRFIESPTRSSVAAPSRGRTISADLYRPRSSGPHPPLLLVHGVGPKGKDEERIALLARDLASAGYTVLVPDLEGMKTLRIRITDAEDVLQSFLYLSSLSNVQGRGAMLGVDCGAGPVLLAAADPRVREKVGIVATVGGYYDLRNILLFGLTGVYEYRGVRGSVRPDASTRWMVAYRNLDLIRLKEDRERFGQLIEKRNRYEMVEADRLARALGPEARALHEFLKNTDQDRFVGLYEGLSLPVREQVYQLSPARAMRYVTASFIIAHGMDDDIIPYTESLRLADAVGDQGRVRLALLPQFMHSGPAGASPESWIKQYVLGGWRLFSAIYALLEKTSDGRR